MRFGVLALCAAACGRFGFEPAAPGTLDYGEVDRIVVYNDVDPTLTHPTSIRPTLIGEADEFSIEPDIEAITGLTFDATNGKILGQASIPSPATEYTVTATGPRGSTTATFIIRTGPGFEVFDGGDQGDASAADNECAATGTTKCTLRAALEQLNAWDATPRLVVIPQASITLAGKSLVITTPLEIIGKGRNATAISGDQLSRVFTFADNLTSTLARMTVKDGLAEDEGGCIFARGGDVTLRQMVVKGCVAPENGGGAMLSDSFGSLPLTVTISETIFENNTSMMRGGGLATGVSLGAGATIQSSTFSNNNAAADGGGLFFSSGVLGLNGNLFVSNRGFGGGLMMEGSSIGDVRNTTFHGNLGGPDSGGAILVNAGSLTLTSTTITDNTCTNCFFGAGIRTFTNASVTLDTTILFDNIDTGTGELANINFGPTTSLGHNLTNTPMTGVPYTPATGDLFATDPKLGPLGDNGGPSHTRPIADTSPAFNAGGTDCPIRDQRGVTRPARGACDIGAFELE